MMNTNEVAIRCGEHAFTRLQKLLPQQDRLLPKIYQNEDQYIIYWESIHWFESSDKREAELVRAFNRAFDYLEECPFDQDGNILPGYDFESIIAEADSDDYQYRSNDFNGDLAGEKDPSAGELKGAFSGNRRRNQYLHGCILIRYYTLY